MEGKRILEIRNKLGLKQVEFAKRLGLSHTTISTTESGKTPLTEANMRLICFTFSVNETWLRHGEGPMFNESAGPEEQELLRVFDELTPDGRKMVLEYAELILKNEKAFRGLPPKASPNPEPEAAPDLTQEFPETRETTGIGPRIEDGQAG